MRLFWDDPYERRTAEAGAEMLPNVHTPNLRGNVHGVAFRTNALGFRGPDYAPRAGAGVRRIAITGDSFVMGWGVEEADVYASQLQRLLDQDGDGDRYEVINTGLLDINIQQAMERLSRAVDAYAPEVVVYGATLNDIVGPSYKATYPPLRAVALALRYRAYEDSPLHVMRLLWPRWVALQERLSPSLDYSVSLHRNYFENEAAWSDFTRGLDAFAAIAHERARCGHVLIHTNLNRLDEDHPFRDIYAKIESAALERGLTVTRSFPFHQGRRPLDLKLSIADGHPNAAGHALLAEALLAGLRSLPDACWRPLEPAATPGG